MGEDARYDALPELLTVAQAAKYLSVALDRFKHWVKEGRVPQPLNIDGMQRYPKATARAILELLKTLYFPRPGAEERPPEGQKN